MARTLVVKKAVGKAGSDGMECALALTNGRIMLATRHGAPVYLQQRSSLHDCAVCREPAPRDKRIDHEHLRSVLVVADVKDAPAADLKMTEVIRFEHTPHPVEFEMYYSA